MKESERIVLEIEEQGLKDVVAGVLSGGTHIEVWRAIMAALDEATPGWNSDRSRSAVGNAVAAIHRLAGLK